MADATLTKTFLGKYRGTVVNNIDPMLRGRLLVTVPDAIGLTPSSWAEPCVPLAGSDRTADGRLHGPADRRRGVGRVRARRRLATDLGGLPLGRTLRRPAPGPSGPARSRPTSCCRRPGQNSIVISDLPGPTGGIMLKSTTGATLIVNDTGIYIQNGKGASIVLTGPTVNVNLGALTVV